MLEHSIGIHSLKWDRFRRKTGLQMQPLKAADRELWVSVNVRQRKDSTGNKGALNKCCRRDGDVAQVRRKHDVNPPEN